MMRFLSPVLIVGVAVAIFFYFTQPRFNAPLETLTDDTGQIITSGGIYALQEERDHLQEGLANAQKLRDVEEKLLADRRAFAQTDLDRLSKAIPDNVDNVRLIIDINAVAQRWSMSIRNLKIKTDEGQTQDAVIAKGPQSKKGSVILGFSVSGPYNNFQSFMADLAKSLRLVDVSSITFNSNDKNFYDYTVEIQTYWLK